MSVIPGARRLRFAVPERHRFRELQMLEDAVNFRLARLAAPCLECQRAAAGSRCDDHSVNVSLVAGYMKLADTVMGELSRTK
ncbi:MAG: hypothetical protein ACRDNZ_19330 [Streptosporangiaceae bacterium]